MRELLTIDQVADRLGVTVPSVRWLRQDGRFAPAIRIGRRLRWDAADVDAWVTTQREDRLPTGAAVSVQRYEANGRVRYRARVKSHGREVATRVFDRKQDAVAWEQDQSRQLRSGEWLDPRRGRVTLASLAPEWLESRKRLKRKTQEADASAWRHQIEPRFGRLPIASITDAQVAHTRFPQVDIAIQRENLYRRSKRLVVFDMDSTLIQGEVIDELAELLGKKAEVSALTKRAMEGEMDFQESLIRRVSLLKGLTRKDLDYVYSQIKLSPGAGRLIKALKRLGYRIAIISGGFTYFVERLKNELGVHYAYANALEFEDETVTGRLQGLIVDGRRKADLMELLAQQEGVLLDQVIAVGDGANDLQMLKKAGLGIAFNAKPLTKALVGTSITQKNMDSILYLLGITDRELDEMGIR